MKFFLAKGNIERFRAKFPQIEFSTDLSMCHDAEAGVFKGGTLTNEFLDSMPNLKWVQLTSAGFNRADFEYLRQRNITLTCARGAYSEPCAEDVVCKLLVLERQVRKYILKQGKSWGREPQTIELCGKTAAVLGAGSIGVEVAKRLKAFNMTVLGYKSTPCELPYFDRLYFGEKELPIILGKADYVIVCLALNDKTHHLINKETISMMKDGAVFVNISRGEIVSEPDLYDALVSGKLKSAALDVFEKEPPASTNPLLALENVFVTCHQAVHSERNMERFEEVCMENIRRYLTGEPLLNVET